MIRLDNNWEFTEKWSDSFARFEGEAQAVRLPHNVRELSLHYADPADYSLLCGYRRKLDIPESWKGKRLFLQFDGAAHIATVYCNGRPVCVHNCGYTAFRAEITSVVRYGAENTITVRLDTTENASVPPFGYMIDYLTYGGIYRDVWLDVRPEDYIEDIFIYTPELNKAHIDLTIKGDHDGVMLKILDKHGDEVYSLTAGGEKFDLTLQDAQIWDPYDPYLYTCEVTLLHRDGRERDVQRTTFGFRTATFKTDGFYLNNKKFFIRGLNRHQSYPYMGYAASESLQREDARILKEELACNAVRTSHYPQSQCFIDECDKRGLLVFTEIPGWQHIGDEGWKDQAIENTREMILQYRNHPSIILWGVRINESLDDDDFYTRTNKLAHELDPSRMTGGVRYIKKSNLLEDVYTYNDFSLDSPDKNGVLPKKEVMSDPEKPLLVTENNGHMFPTKSYDPWAKRQEHALRHAKVQGAALSSPEHAGCFAWCMFDYQTHQDFGSGDRICYHGVMDAFRNPKLAAAVYASQGEETPVLEVGSGMAIGDYPGGTIGDIYLFTNADSVKLHKNNEYVTEFTPKEFTGLKHEPVLVDDTIGELLEKQESFGKRKASTLRDCLLAAQKYGIDSMPLGKKLKLGWASFRYGLKFKDAYALYGKYVGNWGQATPIWRFDAIKDGVVVASSCKAQSRVLHLDIKPSQTLLTEGDAYDSAAVRIRLLDEYDNVASYAQAPIGLSVEGPIEIIGPAVVTAEGGMCGTYIRTTGEKGEAKLHITCTMASPIDVNFTVR